MSAAAEMSDAVKGRAANNSPAAPSALTRRIGKLLDLTPKERDFLESIQGPATQHGPRHDLWQVGDDLRSTLVVRAGWLARYRMMPDGRRQIVSFALPGDLLALHMHFHSTASYDVATIGRAAVSNIAAADVDALYAGYPRLAAVINWTMVRDYRMLAEHVVSLGRRCARERLLQGLLELWQRLCLVELAEDHDFALPLTQTDLGDWLGLSAPHVNRTLKGLEREGLVRRRDDHIILADVQRMMDVADYIPSLLEDFAL
jgi:CRP-like cAMP-binding protein